MIEVRETSCGYEILLNGEYICESKQYPNNPEQLILDALREKHEHVAHDEHDTVTQNF